MDNVKLEEGPMETIGEVHDQTQQAADEPTLPALPKSGSIVEHLYAVAAEVGALEHELVEARLRIETQETELAELRRTRASDIDTMSTLMAELDERRRRMDAFQAVARELTVELDS
jgi:hypothetical protein